MSEVAINPSWTKIIVPQRGLFEVPWRELWAYRDLMWLLARRNLAVNYKQTVLGPFWYILQPLLVTTVFSYLFGRMARYGTDNIPHYLFYMSGLVLWNFFAEIVQKASRSFTDYEQLFAKVYFPRLAVPFAVVLTNVVPLLVQFSLFSVGLTFYLLKNDRWVDPSWRMIFAPLIFLQVALLATGIGCLVAALTKRFRDLVVGVQVGLQLWMFGSAIIFPVSRIAADDRWLFFLNPIVPMVESFRLIFIGISRLSRGTSPSAQSSRFSCFSAGCCSTIGQSRTAWIRSEASSRCIMAIAISIEQLSKAYSLGVINRRISPTNGGSS